MGSNVNRSKSLSIELYRSRWSDEDLARLAKLIQHQTGDVAIQVISSDGQDRLSASDPAFILGNDMPTRIRSVKLSSTGSPNIEVMIGLPEYDDLLGGDPPKATISGTPQQVSALFHEVEREFRHLTLPGGRLVKFASGFGGLLVVFGLTVAAFASLLVILVALVAERLPWLTASRGGTTFLILGAGIMFGVSVVLTGGTFRAIRRTFPWVEFAGRLEPSNAFQRAGVLWFLGFIVLPLALNWFSGILF